MDVVSPRYFLVVLAEACRGEPTLLPIIFWNCGHTIHALSIHSSAFCTLPSLSNFIPILIHMFRCPNLPIFSYMFFHDLHQRPPETILRLTLHHRILYPVPSVSCLFKTLGALQSGEHLISLYMGNTASKLSTSAKPLFPLSDFSN